MSSSSKCSITSLTCFARSWLLGHRIDSSQVSPAFFPFSIVSKMTNNWNWLGLNTWKQSQIAC